MTYFDARHHRQIYILLIYFYTQFGAKLPNLKIFNISGYTVVVLSAFLNNEMQSVGQHIYKYISVYYAAFS